MVASINMFYFVSGRLAQSVEKAYQTMYV